MSLLTRNLPKEQPVQPPKQSDKITIAEPTYESAVVDTRYQDRKLLITHVEGSSWVVNYYQQYLGKDDELIHHDVTRSAVHQQYKEISKLEIKVSSALSASQDEETGAFETTGEATIYAGVIPNKNDIFIADIGDGREGLFTITNVVRLSILRDSAFNIVYVLTDYLTDEKRKDLEKKTVLRTHFVKTLIEHGKDPVLVNEDYKVLISLDTLKENLLGNYLPTFFNKRIGSLSVPDQNLITYDYFVVKMIKDLIGTNEHPLIRKLKLYSIKLVKEQEPYTLWNAILQMSDANMAMANERLALVDARYFGRVPQFEGVYYSNAGDVVYPIDKNNGDYCSNPFSESLPNARDIRHSFPQTSLGSLLQLRDDEKVGIERLVPIHPVNIDDYYVLSESFYFNDKENMSQLEFILKETLEGKPVDKKTLARLCEQNIRWNRLERFYYTPILLALLKMAKLGF